ncbi:MAG TPA: MMPL family transporter [Polyangiales bacterium]
MGFLANLSTQHRRPVLIVLALLTLGAVLYGRNAARSLVAGGFDDPGSESSRADSMLEEQFGLGTPDVVVAYSHDTLTVRDPAFVARLEPALEVLRAQPGVERVSSPYGSHPDAIVSNDGKVTLVAVRFAKRGHAAEELYDKVEPKLKVDGLSSWLGGAIPAARQAQEAAESDLARAELVTLPLVAIMLVVFFRGVVVAMLPLLVGGFAVASALACIRLLTHVTDVSIFAMNIVTFVGLGVAIDYSLFMTARFRDELAAGSSVKRAVEHTLQTSGRTIAYSGAAVAVSLLALSVFPLMLLRSVAIAGSLVVLMSLVGALLLLPSLLALLGPRIEWLRIGRRRRDDHGSRFWHLIAEGVMKRPMVVTLGVTLLLVVLGLPFLRVNPAVAGASALPEEAPARHVAELLDSGRFPAAATAPVLVLATLPQEVLSRASLERLEAYANQLARVPHVKRVEAAVGGASGMTASQLSAALSSPAADTLRARLSPIVRERDTALRVVLDVAPLSDQAEDTVHAIRKLHPAGMKVLVTSPAARLSDLKHALFSRLPWALSVVGVATFVVLFLAFGSVIMPLKAIIMNILSLTASFGALVWIFQDGRLETVLGFRSPGNIEITVPVVMFAVVFGLAMDYELFLLSRIREAYDQTGDTRTSVARGLERTAALITRAALLLVAVMVGFISADMLLVKEMGVGMAVAVIVDATIVRALLVPASMQLLGAYNWWAPPRLAAWWRRMHLAVDESEPVPERDDEQGGSQKPAGAFG